MTSVFPARGSLTCRILARGLLACGVLAYAAAPVLAQSAAPVTEAGFAAQAAALQGASDLPVVVNCTLKPLRVVHLAAPAQMVVERIHARPGDAVKQGQLLVELDSSVLETELALARARASDRSALDAATVRRDGLALREFRLAEALAKRAVSRAQHDAAALELAVAEAEVVQAENALYQAALEVARTETLLAETRLLSPVNGIIGENLIDPGEAAGADPVATIYVNQPLRVEAFVPMAAIDTFAAQARFVATIGTRGRAVELELDYVSPVADLASGTVSVFFQLQDASLLPGSTCQIKP